MLTFKRLLFLALACAAPAFADDHRGLSDLSARVPKNTGIFMAFDLRGRVDLKSLLQTTRERLPADTRERLSEAEASTSVRLDELTACVEPAGFLALMPAAGQATLWGNSEAPSGRPDPSLTYCKSNLKNLATGLEMYACDNAGHYPQSLRPLTPNYLKSIPPCPAANQDTYSASYQYATVPDAFTLYCQGHHHRQETPDHPQYNAYSGLISTYQPPEATRQPEPELAFGAPLSDEGATRSLLLRLYKEPDSDGQIWGVSPAGPFLTLRDGFLLGATSKPALAALLRAFSGESANLAASPQFAAMRKKIAIEAGALFYLGSEGLADALPRLLDADPGALEANILPALRGTQYLAGSLSYEGETFSARGYVGLDRHSRSLLVQSLLTPRPSPFQTAGLLPLAWGNFQAINAHYLVDVMLDTLSLVPEARKNADETMALVGQNLKLDLPRELWGIFTGEVAFSSNAPNVVPESMQSGFNHAREAGQLTACTSNLKNQATALEMYASDNQGRYPKTMGQLTPNYLRHIPICPGANKDTYSEAYQVGAGPDLYTITCKGHYHRDPDYPRYTSMAGLLQRPEGVGDGSPQPARCTSNLKNIGTAAEMYATDNGGRYPKRLSLLTPSYLRFMPRCAVAGKDTYSRGYKSAVDPDRFTVYCQGSHHGEANRPAYTSEQGLLLGSISEPDTPAEIAQKKAEMEKLPSFVIALGVKDIPRARQLATGLVGDPLLAGAEIREAKDTPLPVYISLTEQPLPVLMVGVGTKSREMLVEALTPRPLKATLPAHFSSAWKEQPQWITQGFADLSGTVQAIRMMLSAAPEPALRSLVELLPNDPTLSYFVGGDGDGIMAESRGNGTFAATQLMAATAILVPNFIRARSFGQLTACKSNLKNAATALEMYASDNAGYYPTSLKALTPNYLRVIPLCPGGQKDTYSESYQVNNDPPNTFNYTLWCQGANHTRAGLNGDFPQYNSRDGLVDRH